MFEQIEASQIPLVDSLSRNMSLVYTVRGNLLTFVIGRSDGFQFVKPTFSPVALDKELERRFIDIADLFEGY